MKQSTNRILSMILALILATGSSWIQVHGEEGNGVVSPTIIFSNYVNEALPGVLVNQEANQELKLGYKEGKKKVAFLRVDMEGILQEDIRSAKLKIKLKDDTINLENSRHIYLCGVNESSGEIINETRLKWNTTMGESGLINVNKRLIKPSDVQILNEDNKSQYIEFDFTEFAKTTKLLKHIREEYFSQRTLVLCLMAEGEEDLLFGTEENEENPLKVEIRLTGEEETVEKPLIPLFGLDDPELQKPLKVKPPIPAYEDDIAYGGFESTENFSLRYPIDYDSVDIDPSVPEYPEPVKESPWAKLGYVDVTFYGADPTGQQDSTDAIQQAVRDAYDYNMATYVPEGEYLISDTINLYSPKGTFHNIRRRGNVMVGSSVGNTVFKLSDSNDEFNGLNQTPWQDEDKSIYLKPLVYLWVENNNKPGKQKDNENYNNILRNITIDLGENNPGAVGVRHRGCEGSSLENITVYARDSFAGIFGMLGSGGMMSDITVDGGRYGIYCGGTQEVATVVGFELKNQKDMAVYFKATCPLSLVGGRITKDGGVFIGGMEVMSHSGEPQEGSSLVGLYDVSLENTGSKPATALDNTNRGIFGVNVYVKGIQTLVSVDMVGQNIEIADYEEWKHINKFSWAKEHNRPMGFVNGVGKDSKQQNILQYSKKEVVLDGPYKEITKSITEDNFINEKYPGKSVALDNPNINYLGVSNKENLRRVSFIRIDMSDINQESISEAVLNLRLMESLEAGEEAKLYLMGIQESQDPIWNASSVTWNNMLDMSQSGEGVFKKDSSLLVPVGVKTVTESNGEDNFSIPFTDFARQGTLLNGSLSVMICTDSEKPLKLARKQGELPMTVKITENGDYSISPAPFIPVSQLLNIDPLIVNNQQVQPPEDLVSRHVYPYKETSIDWLESENENYANIKDFGAVGDGITDDTQAIKDAIAANKYVFIPRGVYKIKDTITLKSNTRLFGVSKTISVIRPVHSNGSLQPAFKTPNNANAHCIMSSFKVLLPSSEKNVAGILWQSGRRSIMHGMWVTGTVTNDGQWPTYWIKVANNGGGRIYTVIGIGQTDTSNSQSRLFLVEDTHEPLYVYHLHTQHIKNEEANAEVRNSENVVIFSVKSEVTYGNPPLQPAVLLIKDSRNVLVMGYGGNFSSTDGYGSIQLENSRNVLICNMGRFMPHRNGQLHYYYVSEEWGGEYFNSVDAEDYLNYYKRGKIDYISLTD